MLASIQEIKRKREKEREGDLSKARVSPSKRRRGTRSSISLLLDAISLLARRDDGSPSFSPSLPLTEAEISREADIPICVSGDVSTVVGLLDKEAFVTEFALSSSSYMSWATELSISVLSGDKTTQLSSP